MTSLTLEVIDSITKKYVPLNIFPSYIIIPTIIIPKCIAFGMPVAEVVKNLKYNAAHFCVEHVQFIVCTRV